MLKMISQVSGAGKNSTSLLYSETTKTIKFLMKRKTLKNVKKTKRFCAYEGYASTYNVEATA